MFVLSNHITCNASSSDFIGFFGYSSLAKMCSRLVLASSTTGVCLRRATAYKHFKQLKIVSLTCSTQYNTSDVHDTDQKRTLHIIIYVFIRSVCSRAQPCWICLVARCSRSVTSECTECWLQLVLAYVLIGISSYQSESGMH